MRDFQSESALRPFTWVKTSNKRWSFVLFLLAPFSCNFYYMTSSKELHGTRQGADGRQHAHASSTTLIFY